MSRWARLVEQRQVFRKAGLALFTFAIVISILDAWIDNSPKVPAAVLFALLAMQCFMAQSFTGQLVAAQERIDMLRVAKRMDPE